ncbi:MAG TPA: P-loop NTPase [Acidimicrobiia bacterium]|nr:P-loop NTPase [Acidimicrobiia bacterium]
MSPVTPTVDQVRGVLAGVMDPELKASITDLGMVGEISIDADGVVTVPVVLTTAGCPLRHQIKVDVESKVLGLPGVESVRVEYGEMTAEQKAAAMSRARFQAREHAEPTEVAATTRVLAVASGKGGVGKSSITVNLAAALAARGLSVGVLDADIWGFSVPRMLGIDERLGGTDGKIEPVDVPVESTDGGTAGRLAVVSMGFLVDDERSALMWRGLVLTRALEQFLTDVRWGELDYLLIDMPPGTGDIQMGLARMLPQAEMLVVTTPARAAQNVATRVADMARRSHMKVAGVVENMTEFVTPSGERYQLFGEGGGAALALDIDAPLLARIPIESAVATGGDLGRPAVLAAPDGAAARAFRDLAEAIVEDVLPPIEMAGCTARMMELIGQVDAP